MNKPAYTCDALPTCLKQLEICKKVIKSIDWMAREYVINAQTWNITDEYVDAMKLLKENGLGGLVNDDNWLEKR